MAGVTTEPDHVHLDDYACTQCGAPVQLVDGYWSCECYQVGAHELDCGYHELPAFWVETDSSSK